MASVKGLGPVGGAAMIYTLSSLLLLATVGFPRLRQMPRLSAGRQSAVRQL